MRTETFLNENGQPCEPEGADFIFVLFSDDETGEAIRSMTLKILEPADEGEVQGAGGMGWEQVPRDELGHWIQGTGGTGLSPDQKSWYNQKVTSLTSALKAGTITKPKHEEELNKLRTVIKATAATRKEEMVKLKKFDKDTKGYFAHAKKSGWLTEPGTEEAMKAKFDKTRAEMVAKTERLPLHSIDLEEMKPVVKAPYEMNMKEFALSKGYIKINAQGDTEHNTEKSIADIEAEHITEIKKAQNEGKTVPESVLKEYPTIFKKEPEQQDSFLSQLSDPEIKTDYESAISSNKQELAVGLLSQEEFDKKQSYLQSMALARQNARASPDTVHILHAPGKPYIAEPTYAELRIYEKDNDTKVSERDYYPPIARKEQVLRVMAKNADALGEVKVVILPFALKEANAFTDLRTPGTIYLGQKIAGEPDILINTGVLDLAETVERKSQLNREVAKQFTNTEFSKWKDKLSTLTKDDELQRTLMHEKSHLDTFDFIEQETGSAMNYRRQPMLDIFKEYRDHPSFDNENRIHSDRGIDVAAYHTGEAIAEDLRIMNGEKFGQGQALLPSYYSAEGDLIHPENVMERRAILKKIFKMGG